MLEIKKGNADLIEAISIDNSPPQQEKYYQLHWKEWKNNSPDGGGEFRDIAEIRLLECLEQESQTVDLSDLGLTSLPDILPPHITSLILTRNPLMQVPERWPDSLQQITIDSHSSLQTRLHENISSPDYQGPQINFIDERKHPDEIWPTYNGDEAELLQVLTDGQRLSRAAEQAIAENQQWHTFSPPPPLLRATGILAGLTLAGGIGTYLYNRWRAAPEAQRAAPPATALMLNEAAPRTLEVAQVPPGNVNAPTKTPPPQLSTAQAIEHELIHFFRQQNGSFAGGKPRKEALIATAAVWLFPTGQPFEPEDKVIQLAGRILYAAGHYGGKPGETISAPLAKAVIRNWVFNTVLGAPLRDYIASKIIANKYPSYFTLSSLRHLLSLPKLHVAGLLYTNNVPPGMWGNLNAMWHTFLREEIPVLDDAEYKEAGMWPLADINFLAFSTGAEYLADLGNIKQYNLTEITAVGASIWGMMASPGARTDMLPYLLTPSLWYIAQTQPDKLQTLLKNKKQYAQIVVPETLENWKQVQSQAEQTQRYLNVYQTAINAWSSKGQLADKIIARCPLSDILIYHDDRQKPYNVQDSEWVKKLRESAKERYLLYDVRPCKRDDVPYSLRDEYKKLTRNVADAYRNLDEALLVQAVNSATKEEKDFITSANASVHPAYLHMRTKSTAASGMGGMAWANDIFIDTDNADLFSVKNNKEERIYALKRGENINSGYSLFRVDKDVKLYIKHGILSHKQLWKNYQQQDGVILAGGYEFSFAVAVNPRTKLSLKKEGTGSLLGNYFSQQHGNRFYDSLHQAGHDYSGTEKIWQGVKHIIPFYDCIEGLASGDSMQIAQALPSCMLDLLALVPVAGQAAALGGKYGLSMAQGIRRGIFKASQGASSAAVAASMAKGIALPTNAQILSLLKNTLRAMDPGVEMLCKGSVLAGRLIADVSDAALAAKLKATVATKKVAQKTVYPTAKLPHNGPDVSVKKLADDLYVVVNPQTDEAFGNYYHLNKGKLREAEVRYHLPEDPHYSGSQPKRLKQAPPPEQEQEQAQMQLPAKYNELPPAADNVDYWNSVQRINAFPIEPSLPPGSNIEIQPLQRFLPLSTPDLKLAEKSNSVATATLNNIMAPLNWRAYAGIDNAPHVNIPPWITQMRLKLKEHIAACKQTHIIVRDKLWSLQNHQNLLETDVGEYLVGILDTDDPEVIKEAFKRLTEVVERGEIFLNASEDVNYSNFIIASTDHIPVAGNPEQYISTMDKNLLVNTPIAFVIIPDPEKRVFINAERFQNVFINNNYITSEGDMRGLEESLTNKGAEKKAGDDEGELYEDVDDDRFKDFNLASRLSDDLTHEITHVTSNTGDMFNYHYPPKGQLLRGEDLLNAFVNSFDPREENGEIPMLFEKQNLNAFIDQLQDIQGISENLAYSAIMDAITTDPMLFANILMDDAEVLATIIRDLAEGRAFDEEMRFSRDTASTRASREKFADIIVHGLITLIARQTINVTPSVA